MQQKRHRERRAGKIRDGTLTLPDEKVCRICGTLKKADEFERSNQSRDGLNTRCKACYSEYAKKYYRENKERSIERARKSYKENRAHVREVVKKWRKNNKERINSKKCDKAVKRLDAYTPIPGTGKTCSDCLIWKYYEDFVFNRYRIDLHDKRCKICFNAFCRQYKGKKKEQDT